MKKYGWDRLRACHEMCAYNGAMVTTMAGVLYETSGFATGNSAALKVLRRPDSAQHGYCQLSQGQLVCLGFRRPRQLRLAGGFLTMPLVMRGWYFQQFTDLLW